jgi:HD-GYP domain-containing protein (c-di-GMP phosphodiesterase class II)
MSTATSLESFDQKLDRIADTADRIEGQIGRFTEGLTELRLIFQDQAEASRREAEVSRQRSEAICNEMQQMRESMERVIERQENAIAQQSEAIARQSEAIAQQMEMARLQAESVARLVAIFEQERR